MQVADLLTELDGGNTIFLNDDPPGSSPWQLNGVKISNEFNTTYANCKRTVFLIL